MNCCTCCAQSAEAVVRNARSNDEAYVDGLRGKVAVITGGTAGIGEHTALVLFKLGMRVVLTGRSAERLRAAEERIRDAASKDGAVVRGELITEELDVSKLPSVSGFVDRFKARGLPLHLLINNAGIMALPRLEKNEDGLELQYATNHLGHFALTELLLDVLKASAPSRIINVASQAHRKNKLDPANPCLSERQYDPWDAYGGSKACNILHAMHLAERLKGTEVTAYSLHPGVVATELGRNNCLAGCFYAFCGCMFLNVSQGAATTAWLCVNDDARVTPHAGRYFAKPGSMQNPAAVCTLENAEKLDRVSRYQAQAVLTPEAA